MKKIDWLQLFTTVTVGHIVNFLLVYGFDYVLYPVIMVYFGIIKGSLIMWFLSFIVCYSLILFYNWSKKDWLGIETAKIGIEHGHTSAFLSILQWARKKGKWMLLIFLSIFFDPFITLVSIRDSSHGYKRMNKNDWTIFMSSFIISNLWWSMAVFTGLSVFELIEKYVTTLF